MLFYCYDKKANLKAVLYEVKNTFNEQHTYVFKSKASSKFVLHKCSKKFYVYVQDGDKVKKVSFGDTTGLSIKRDDPARRKSFRARHNCDNPGPKTKARYWSCYQWRAGAKVDN